MSSYKNLYSMCRKKQQKYVNESIKRLNKNIENDDIWRGRFYARQFSSGFNYFEDGSGGVLTLMFRLVDKKTNKYITLFTDASNVVNFGRAWRAMNDFIVNDIKANISESKNDPTDYKYIKSDPLKAEPLYEYERGVTASYKNYCL